MKVLLPVDGSDSAQATLEWAVTTLDRSTNEFVLLTVISDPMIAEYEIEDATKVLHDAKAFLTERGATVLKSEYVQGDPVDGICRYAEESGIDQILLGSHGRSGVAKLLLGSVSEGVLEKAKVPVFIYRNIQKKPAHA